ncbi:unnamed protein product [Owenia fusiformis]|uniref:Sulfotransferase n=1 Tax=Owenia fusiformis TaxID=6347 RepID=A0A8S4PIY6_OWEFU|nr:unnamed protein product [Owenia fusiformis]
MKCTQGFLTHSFNFHTLHINLNEKSVKNMAVTGNLKYYILLMIILVLIIAFLVSTDISFNMVSVLDVGQQRKGAGHIRKKAKGTENMKQKRMDAHENLIAVQKKGERDIEQKENEDYVEQQDHIAEDVEHKGKDEYEDYAIHDNEIKISRDDIQPQRPYNEYKNTKMQKYSYEEHIQESKFDNTQAQDIDTQYDHDNMDKDSNNGINDMNEEYDNEYEIGPKTEISKVEKTSNEINDNEITPKNKPIKQNVGKDNIELCEVQHFIIITQPRSGSNLLDSYINQHPYITSYSELCHDSILAKFNMTKKSPKEDILQHILNSLKRDIHNGNGCAHLTTGFKLHIWSLETLSVTVTDIIQSLKNPKVIILYRKNMLEQFISWEAASKNHMWWSTFLVNQYSLTLKIPMVRDFILRQKQNLKSLLLELSRTGVENIMEITYEELVNDKINVMNKLFTYLGYAPTDREVVSFLVKQNPQPLKKKLKNYDEIMAYFSESDLNLDIDDLDNV